MLAEGALRGAPHQPVVLRLVRVLHLRAEDILTQRLRRLMRLVARHVLLAYLVQLFLHREVRLELALRHLL